MTDTTPKIRKFIGQKLVRQKQSFDFSVKRAFSPSDGSLRFELIEEPPTWLSIDKRTGIISGFAPPVVRGSQHLLAVKASNQDGEVVQHIFLKIVAGQITKDFMHQLQDFLNKKYHGYYQFDPNHPYMHELLEHIYEYFKNSDNPELFLEQLEQNAEKCGIALGEEVTYNDFKEVVTTMDSKIEKKMQKHLESAKQAALAGGDLAQLKEADACNVAAMAELNNQDFRNKFRQGSQPLGVHAIPVWDYLATPDLHNWSSVGNVLDSSGEAIVASRQATLEAANEEKMQQKSSMQKKP